MKKLINETPDTIRAIDSTTGREVIFPWYVRPSIPFYIWKERAFVGYEHDAHGDIFIDRERKDNPTDKEKKEKFYNAPYNWEKAGRPTRPPKSRDIVDFLGRIWPNEEIISFWNPQPRGGNIEKIIKQINSAVKERLREDPSYKKEGMNFTITDKWLIEVHDNVTFGKEITSILVPISEYKGGMDLSKKDNDIEHVVAPILKKNPALAKKLSKKGKQDLWNYFKNKGSLDRDEERMLKLVHKEVVETLLDSSDVQLISENPDLFYSLKHGRNLDYTDKDAYGFKFTQNFDDLVISKRSGITHANGISDLYGDKYGEIKDKYFGKESRNKFIGYGRIWIKSKAISFWNKQPTIQEVKKMLPLIKKKMRDQNKININFDNDWVIEVYDNNEKDPFHGKEVPLIDYINGSKSTSSGIDKFEHLINPIIKNPMKMQSMSLEDKKKLYDYFKSKGRLNKEEERLYKILRKEAYENMDFAVLLTENPDAFIFRTEKGKLVDLGTHMQQARPFIISKDEKDCIIGNKPNMLHFDLINKLDKNDPKRSKNFDYGTGNGRLWIKYKAMSFWNKQPTIEQLKKWLPLIEKAWKEEYNTTLKFDNSWIIEVYNNPKSNNLYGDPPSHPEKLMDYIRGGKSSSQGGERIDHLINPIIKNPSKIQKYSLEDKKKLYNYFKAKGRLTPDEERLYKMLRKEAFENVDFALLLTEADRIYAFYNDKKYDLNFKDDDAVPFIIDKHYKLYMGQNDGMFRDYTHGDIHVSYNNPDLYKTKKWEGRLWTKRKVISFWNPQPKDQDLKKVISILEKELKTKMNDWLIEYFSLNFGQELRPLKDALNGGIVNSKNRFEHLIEPIKKNPSKIQSYSLEDKKKLYNYFKSKGRLSPEEERMYKILRKEAYENPDFSMLLTETPDNVKYDGKTYDNWSKDALAFGKIGSKWYIGLPGRAHQNMYVSKYENTHFYKDLERFGPSFDRPNYSILGRVWLKSKVMSFWNPQPKPNELQSVLSNIEKEFKRRISKDEGYKKELSSVGTPTSLNFNDGWAIEQFEGRKSKFIPIDEYMGKKKAVDMSNELNNIQHMANPMEKIKAIKKLSDVQKASLYNYYKAKGNLTPDEKRMYQVLRMESYTNPDFAMLLTENPNYVVRKKEFNLDFNEDDAYAFGIYKGKAYIGKPSNIHQNIGDNYDNDSNNPWVKTFGTSYNRKKSVRSHRENYYFLGRFWKKSKIISFWNPQPKPNELARIISLVNKEAPNAIGASLNINNSWKIEIYENYHDVIKQEWGDDDSHLVTVEEYIKGKTSIKHMTDKENNIQHMIAPMLKSKNVKNLTPQQKKHLWDYFKAKGNLTPDEKRMYKLLKQEALTNPDFAFLLTENAEDTVNIKNESLSWTSTDAYPFGYLPSGKLAIGVKGREHFNIYYNVTLSNLMYATESKIKKTKITSINQLDYDNKSRKEIELNYYILKDLINGKTPEFQNKECGRTKLKFPGRLWVKGKHMSFWNPQPAKSNLRKILADLKTSAKEKAKDIPWDKNYEKIANANFDEWSIEIFMEDKLDGQPILIKDFLKTSITSKNTKGGQAPEGLNHILPPMLKNPKKAKTLSPKNKKELWDYFKKKGNLTPEEERLYKVLKLESYNDLDFAMLLTENPDKLSYMKNDKKITKTYMSKDAITFSVDKDCKNIMIGYNSSIHRDYDYIFGHKYKSDPYFDGRLWTKEKIVSFWNPQPSPQELNKIISLIKTYNGGYYNGLDATYSNKKRPTIKIDNTWYIEKHSKYNEKAYRGWDHHINEEIISDNLIKIEDYLKGSINLGDAGKRIQHNITPISKNVKSLTPQQKKNLWDYFKSKGNLTPEEERLYKLLHMEVYSDHDFAMLISEIKREDMPQIKVNDRDRFVSTMRNDGLDFNERPVIMRNIKHTQEDFNHDKINSIMKSINTPQDIEPIIISNDNQIVDGHHRWMAAKNKFGQDEKINTIVIDLPIDKALEYYRGVETKLYEYRSDLVNPTTPVGTVINPNELPIGLKQDRSDRIMRDKDKDEKEKIEDEEGDHFTQSPF